MVTTSVGGGVVGDGVGYVGDGVVGGGMVLKSQRSVFSSLVRQRQPNDCR